MIAASAGLLTVCITELSLEKVKARALEHFDVVRSTNIDELETALSRSKSAHILIEGFLNSLYDRKISTRDASRALGRLKTRLEELASAGVEIVVLCNASTEGLGPRSHFLPSLCVAADRVVTELLAA